MAATLVLEPTRLVREAQLLSCDQCEAFLWAATDPYFTVGNVRWLHGQGCPDHRLRMWKFAAPA